MNHRLKSLIRPQKFPGKAVVAIALFSLGLWFAIGPGHALLDRDRFLDLLQASGRQREVVFLGLFALLTSLGAPGSALAIAGGLTFGVLWGTIWSTVGATLSGIVSFWLSRYLLHDWAAKRWSAHPLLQRCRTTIARHPLRVVLTMRLVPISPFAIVSYLFGLTNVGWAPYAIGTFLGILPGTLAFVWLGVAGQEAARGGDWRPLVAVIAVLVLLSALPLLIGRSRGDRCQD